MITLSNLFVLLTVSAFAFETRRKFDLNPQNQTALFSYKVEYAPSVKVEIISGKEPSGMIREYTDAIFICQTDANPPKVNYSWFLNDKLVAMKSDVKFVIPNVTRDFHETKVQCKASNVVGQSEGCIKLNVTYGPKFLHQPYSVKVQIGELVVLICEAEGNPPPAYTWIHGRTGNILGTSGKIAMTVDNAAGGVYFCEAYVAGFPEIYAMYEILIKEHLEKIKNTYKLMECIISVTIGILLAVILGLALAILQQKKFWKSSN